MSNKLLRQVSTLYTQCCSSVSKYYGVLEQTISNIKLEWVRGAT